MTRIGVSVQVRTNQKGRRAVTGVASESDMRRCIRGGAKQQRLKKMEKCLRELNLDHAYSFSSLLPIARPKYKPLVIIAISTYTCLTTNHSTAWISSPIKDTYLIHRPPSSPANAHSALLNYRSGNSHLTSLTGYSPSALLYRSSCAGHFSIRAS